MIATMTEFRVRHDSEGNCVHWWLIATPKNGQTVIPGECKYCHMVALFYSGLVKPGTPTPKELGEAVDLKFVDNLRNVGGIESLDE